MCTFAASSEGTLSGSTGIRGPIFYTSSPVPWIKQGIGVFLTGTYLQNISIAVTGADGNRQIISVPVFDLDHAGIKLVN